MAAEPQPEDTLFAILTSGDHPRIAEYVVRTGDIGIIVHNFGLDSPEYLAVERALMEANPEFVPPKRTAERTARVKRVTQKYLTDVLRSDEALRQFYVGVQHMRLINHPLVQTEINARLHRDVLISAYVGISLKRNCYFKQFAASEYLQQLINGGVSYLGVSLTPEGLAVSESRRHFQQVDYGPLPDTQSWKNVATTMPEAVGEQFLAALRQPMLRGNDAYVPGRKNRPLRPGERKNMVKIAHKLYTK
jgi:hypothetical protein